MKVIYSKQIIVTTLLAASIGLQGCGGKSKEILDGMAQNKKGVEQNKSKSTDQYQKLDMPKFSLTVEHYQDCQEIQNDIYGKLLKKRQDEINRNHFYETVYKAPISTNASVPEQSSVGSTAQSAAASDKAEALPQDSGGAPASQSKQVTNVQEKGVDEEDMVKVSENHIFVALKNRIDVLDRKSLEIIGSIDIKGIDNLQIFTDGSRLISVGEVQNLTPELSQGRKEFVRDDVISSPTYEGGFAPKTQVRIFDGESGKLPSLISERIFDATVQETRLIGGRLVIVFRPDSIPLILQDNQSYPYFSGESVIPELPVKVESGKISNIECQKIGKPVSDDIDLRLIKVASLNVRELNEEPFIIGAMGGGDSIYMSQKALYVTKYQYLWSPFDPYASETALAMNDEFLAISKINFDQNSGALDLVAVGGVKGRVIGQWAFKDFPEQGVLGIATTTGNLWDQGASKAQNHLWMLKENSDSNTLEVVSAINNFGSGEDIRSVRYVGNMAYVVTFKKTDPLFAFDLSNPLDPKIIGELKIPGFSAYMHPVAEGRMVGVGFDALDQGEFALYQGVQVSLFDISNPKEMMRLDNKVYGQRGSSSEVTGDHHAFFFDQESSLMAVPMVELTGNDNSRWGNISQLGFSGAVFYKVEDKELKETSRVSHRDLIPKACLGELTYGSFWQGKQRSLDINRIYKIDGRIITVSRFGLKSHNPSNPNDVLLTKQFSPERAMEECSYMPLEMPMPVPNMIKD